MLNMKMSSPRVELDKQTETAEKLVNQYGCLSKEHLLSIWNGDKEKARQSMSYMIKSGAIRTTDDENTLLPHIKKQQKIEISTLDCITVAIDLVKDESKEEGLDLDALCNSFENLPAKICMVNKDNEFLNLIPITASNAVAYISSYNEKFQKLYKNPKYAEGIIYVLVIKDKTLLQKIGSLGATFPHKIALINNESGKQTVTYYNPKSSNAENRK